MTNRLQRDLAILDKVPAAARTWARSVAIGRVVPYVGTSHIRAERLDDDGAVFTVANRRRVQNHIKGVHATATALLAETATGLAFAWHLPDDKLPLLRSMRVDYLRRGQGAMRAEAHVTSEQIERMVTEPRGNLEVVCTVTDESGEEPVRCTMTWAWVPRKR